MIAETRPSLTLGIPLYFHKYNVDFDTVFVITDLRDHFRQFLTDTQQNAFELSFLLEFKHVQAIQADGERIQAYLSLANRYIRVGAEKELYIHTASRKEVLDWASDVMNNNSSADPVLLFETIRNNLYVELKEDAFPRYTRSQQFMTFAISKGESFLKSISAEVSNLNTLERYFPRDLVSDHITDKDLRWAFVVTEDNHDWRLVDAKLTQIDPCNHFDVFISKTKYSIGSSKGIRLIKYTGVIPYDIEQVLPTWNDIECEKKWVPQLLNCSHIRYLRNAEYSSTVLHSVLDFGPYTSTRDTVTLVTQVYDTELNSFIRVAKSTVTVEKPPSTEHVRAQTLGTFSIRGLSENRTRYSQVIYLDPQVEIVSNSNVYNQQVMIRGELFHNGLISAIEYKEKKDHFARPADTLRRYETLEDFYKMYVTSADSVKTWDSVIRSPLSHNNSFSLNIVKKASSFNLKRKQPNIQQQAMTMVQYAHLCEIKEIEMSEAVEKEFLELYEALRNPTTGLSIANRRHRLKTYNNCFIASDAITWLTQYYQCSRPIAIRVATYIQRRGLIDHVMNQYIIRDGYLFFKFVEQPHTDGLDWSPATRKHLTKTLKRFSLSPKREKDTLFDSPLKNKLSDISKNRHAYDQIFHSQEETIVIITIDSASHISNVDYSKVYSVDHDHVYEVQPYCMVVVNGQVQTTLTMNGENPHWNEAFKFVVKTQPIECFVVVFDCDRDTFFGNMIGYANFQIIKSPNLQISSFPLVITDEARRRNESTTATINVKYKTQ